MVKFLMVVLLAGAVSSAAMILIGIGIHIGHHYHFVYLIGWIVFAYIMVIYAVLNAGRLFKRLR